MSGLRSRATAVAAVVVLAGLGLSGCLSENPIVTTGRATTNMTLEEVQSWVAWQFDDAVRASGQEDGWKDIYALETPWLLERGPEQLSLINVWLPERCGDLGGRLAEQLRNREARDPLAMAERVRAFWESNGWQVSEVMSKPDPEAPRFRADREDGALLGFAVVPGGVSLEVISACSANNTVVNWQNYVESAEENPFEEELEQREGGSASPDPTHAPETSPIQ